VDLAARELHSAAFSRLFEFLKVRAPLLRSQSRRSEFNMSKTVTAVVALVMSLSTFVTTGASRAQNAAAGHQIAERWCRGCHVVDLDQKTAPNDAVPSFPSIARMSSTTKMSLTAFLSTSHEPMPNFVLSRTEIANVSAYILSLRKQQ
jgi:mono/diheme cytochrome c family protein